MFPPKPAAAPATAPPSDPMQDPSAQQAGDGLNHYQLDEDESGGFNSLHTAPDGTQTPGGPFNSLDEAKADMDQCFGQGQPDQAAAAPPDLSTPTTDDDSDSSDVAGSYAKAAKKSK
jgi:hypothetical protein